MRKSNSIATDHAPILSSGTVDHAVNAIKVAGRLQALHIKEINEKDCPNCPYFVDGCINDGSSVTLTVRSLYKDLGNLCYRP